MDTGLSQQQTTKRQDGRSHVIQSQRTLCLPHARGGGTLISHQVGKAQQRLYFLRKLKRSPTDQLLSVCDRKPPDLLLHVLVL